MSYEINDIEFQNVTSLPGPERYKYFIKKVCDWQEIWSVKDFEGWGLMADDNNIECVPVWPAHRYAAACCTGILQTCHPETIVLNDWLEKWIPGLSGNARMIAVFPLPNHKGVVVRPDELKRDIKAELEEYY